jgi:hypothetical protein
LDTTEQHRQGGRAPQVRRLQAEVSKRPLAHPHRVYDRAGYAEDQGGCERQEQADHVVAAKRSERQRKQCRDADVQRG